MKILLKSPIITHRTGQTMKPKYGRHQKISVKPDFRIIRVQISEGVLHLLYFLLHSDWRELDVLYGFIREWIPCIDRSIGHAHFLVYDILVVSMSGLV